MALSVTIPRYGVADDRRGHLSQQTLYRPTLRCDKQSVNVIVIIIIIIFDVSRTAQPVGRRRSFFCLPPSMHELADTSTFKRSSSSSSSSSSLFAHKTSLKHAR